MKPHIFGIYDCLGDVHIQFGSRGIYPVRDNYEVEITVYNNDHMVGQRLGIRYYIIMIALTVGTFVILHKIN